MRFAIFKGVRISKTRFLGFASDVTVHKQAEETINKLLLEKEIILKEVHHRIKNNMYTIFILLTTQAEERNNPEIKNILLDAASRVQSMGILYDRLYLSDIKSEVSLQSYLPALIKQIMEIFSRDDSIKVETDIEDIVFGANELSHFGIIINELITNAMKYAFIGRTGGKISINILKKEDLITMTFRDNGNGISEQPVPDSSSGFGMKLVNMLVSQMNGSMSVQNDNGTKFTIVFKKKSYPDKK
jgi:two-component sensor histidine kinase